MRGREDKENLVERPKVEPFFLSPANRHVQNLVEEFNDSLESNSPTTKNRLSPRVLSENNTNNFNLDSSFGYKLESISLKFSPTTTSTNLKENGFYTEKSFNLRNRTFDFPSPTGAPKDFYNNLNNLKISPVSAKALSPATPKGFYQNLNSLKMSPVGTKALSPSASRAFYNNLNNLKLSPADAKALSPATPKRSQNNLNNLKLTPDGAASPDLNYSTDTYVKGNVSSATYVKHNDSYETYLKGNISASTYVKDGSVGDLANFLESPVCIKKPSPTTVRRLSLSGDNVKTIIEANMWCENKKKPLNPILEESVSHEPKVPLKRKSDLCIAVSPLKRAHLERPPSKPKPCLGWSKLCGAGVRTIKTTSGLVKKASTSMVSLNETKSCVVTNPFLWAATNNFDPFMTSQIYCDEKWITKQINEFKKWLNALLTPPVELETKIEQVDVAKVWKDVKNREIEVAPTKESISNKLHTSSKLDSLRRAAQTLFRSQEFSIVATKVAQSVDSGKLSIRDDRDVHLNLSLKSELLSLLLSYNSLWLRIGLETIYNETIPLHSNSDVTGLSSFIIERMFKDPYLLKKYKSVHAPKYMVEIKKFFLKKFLILVYFLDRAKNNKLIAHDPCLFFKNARVKESKEILIQLAKETLSAIGDINKYLKLCGYVVTHKQTYINEYDYGVTNLGVDLRDGVRLTRVMEIILLKKDLTNSLRVPAISRLQKVHNMKLVFDSLEEAGFQIGYDITPKDIVDGYKEKTLSFLWQIIYKFEAPLMVKNVTTIQTWFRSLPIVLKRRKLERIRQKKICAALKIQNWWRRQILSEKLYFFACMLGHHLEMLRRERAAIKIQACYRMYLCRREFTYCISIIIKIQAHCRGFLIRNNYRGRVLASIKIQSFFRMLMERRRFLTLKRATITLQQRYRLLKLGRTQKDEYEQLKRTVQIVQSIFRANKLAKAIRTEYLTQKKAVITIQRWYRATKLMLHQRKAFVEHKTKAVQISTWYKSILMMRNDRKTFTNLKQSVRVIEERYLAKKLMQKEQLEYNRQRCAAILIQRFYRGLILTRCLRQQFLQLRTATISIQRRFRANQIMRTHLHAFNVLKENIIAVQRRFRANKQMKLQKMEYNKLKLVTILIQRRFRARKTGVTLLEQFRKTKAATIVIQQRYRAMLIMKAQRREYLELRQNVITIQKRFRAKLLMRVEFKRYQLLRQSTIIIQTYYRALICMRKQRGRFVALKNAANVIQSRYRALKSMQEQRKQYLLLRSSAICIQKMYKMKLHRDRYLKLKSATITIQRRFRANKMMKVQRQKYLKLRQCIIAVQHRYRALISMRKERLNFLTVRQSVIVIQKNYKAKLAQKSFISLKQAAVSVQRRYRAKKLMQLQLKQYQLLRNAVINVQRRYRANNLMRKQRETYLKLLQTVVNVQQRYRANKLMIKQRDLYQKQRSAAVKIQQFYVGYKAMLQERSGFESKRLSIGKLQSVIKGYLVRRKYAKYFTPEAREQRRRERARIAAAIKIQAAWRSYRTRKVEKRPQVAEMRKRFKLANQNAAPENTLKSRCDKALLTLKLDHYTILQMLNALEDLGECCFCPFKNKLFPHDFIFRLYYEKM